jgi:formylglycine-generating enzyme required for sulfatase activity
MLAVAAAGACGGRVNGALMPPTVGLDAANEVGTVEAGEAGVSTEAAAAFEAAAPMEGAAIPDGSAEADSGDSTVPDGVPSEGAAPAVTIESAPDAAADSAPDATIDGAPDVTVESALDASPDVTLDGAADSVPSALPEASLDAPAPSCSGATGPGLSNCGPNLESCCITLPVPGGSFYRSYDGVSCPGGLNPMPAPELGCYMTMNAPASVSGFRLDKYAVTVGRFRRFVNDVVTHGWQPAAGSGKHVHLHGGLGLANGAEPGTFEAGWDASWNADLPATVDGWLGNIAAGDFSAAPGDGEQMPIAGLPWTEAYAFCIWDGGFLPSEAEWNYAAAGGSEQRVYAWSVPAASQAIDCSYATYAPTGMDCADSSLGLAPVGQTSPKGDGKWGHADLTGNVSQWTLDWLNEYPVPCDDCANLLIPPPDADPGTEPSRATRGGNYADDTANLLVSFRNSEVPAAGTSNGGIGVRCARAP